MTYDFLRVVFFFLDGSSDDLLDGFWLISRSSCQRSLHVYGLEERLVEDMGVK